ncbi:MAG: T9SS type A sorting domain-containing protein [Candidatus Eisenbacteria bacterium]|nr:T9SS type A sorting domain-containing protein [Candidatus Eisenbacteria bacterium]
MRILAIALVALALAVPAQGDYIAFTANQEFLSRIYFLEMDGSVDHYFEYEFYRFCGMEVVDGELYAADAFAPRVYRVDVETGDLEVFIDDWTLYYFYDVAFDGAYFYVDEWDLNRYTTTGSKVGTASFDENVLGMAWDGEYMWTLDDTGVMKCWDMGGWPDVAEVPGNAFAAPSAECRGLWFDGKDFWTAESLDGALGQIYIFEHGGNVVWSVPEPAHSGWGACVVPDPSADIEAFGGSLELAPPAPNPVRDRARFAFELPVESTVTLSVYDVAGRLVATVASRRFDAGSHTVPWDAGRVASGVYFARIAGECGEDAAKFVVLEQD